MEPVLADEILCNDYVTEGAAFRSRHHAGMYVTIGRPRDTARRYALRAWEENWVYARLGESVSWLRTAIALWWMSMCCCSVRTG